MELCAGRLEGRWEGGAVGPLALMLRDGESGFGVEDDDEAEGSGNNGLLFVMDTR